jgi:hypothetical protein
LTEREQPPPVEYFPGDEIRIRVAITSSSNIHAVEVIYAHPEYPWITLTLEGTAELEENSHTYGSRKRFVAVVSGVPEWHHIGAVYDVARVVFYTFNGFPITYDREEEGIHDVELRGQDEEDDQGTPEYEGIPGSWPTLAINSEPLIVLDVDTEIIGEIAKDDEP